jgi:hypothetical protein
VESSHLEVKLHREEGVKNVSLRRVIHIPNKELYCHQQRRKSFGLLWEDELWCATVRTIFDPLDEDYQRKMLLQTSNNRIAQQVLVQHYQ